MNATTADWAVEFEKLAPDEQQRVRDEVSALTKARQREALAKLHGCAKGEGLLAQLLEDRAKERARG